jgi:hypothetical protein
VNQTRNADVTKEHFIDLTPKHEHVQAEFEQLFPLRDKTGKFEQGMFEHYRQTAKIADMYNESVPAHNELEAEAERRRLAIDHLLAWKSIAMQVMTEDQFAIVEADVRKRNNASE